MTGFKTFDLNLSHAKFIHDIFANHRNADGVGLPDERSRNICCEASQIVGQTVDRWLSGETDSNEVESSIQSALQLSGHDDALRSQIALALQIDMAFVQRHGNIYMN